MGKDGCWPNESTMALYMGKSAFPCFLGMDNSKECFNLKYTCVVLRTLTIENAKMYDKSLRLLRVRNKGLKDLVVILPVG